MLKYNLFLNSDNNNSDEYLHIQTGTLNRETANYDLDGIDYDIRICDTPAEMEALVIERTALEIEQEFSRVIVGITEGYQKQYKSP